MLAVNFGRGRSARRTWSLLSSVRDVLCSRQLKRMQPGTAVRGVYVVAVQRSSDSSSFLGLGDFRRDEGSSRKEEVGEDGDSGV